MENGQAAPKHINIIISKILILCLTFLFVLFFLFCLHFGLLSIQILLLIYSNISVGLKIPLSPRNLSIKAFHGLDQVISHVIKGHRDVQFLTHSDYNIGEGFDFSFYFTINIL